MVLLTHEDADHAGNLGPILGAAPQARLATNYVTLSKLLERMTVPLERVRVVNPGCRVPGTPRPLTVVRPPVYDAPGTVGLHDAVSGAAFTGRRVRNLPTFPRRSTMSAPYQTMTWWPGTSGTDR